MEKNKLFEILNDWNFWDKPVPEYIVRQDYQSKINAFLKSGEVIVLKGVRRSGKSTLMINQIRKLVNEGVNSKEILFVNFEDPRFTDEMNTGFLELVFDTYKDFINSKTRPHIFLDEIQNVSQWEKWVRTGYELKRAYFYVTGSSSKLLSKEFGTALSGRNLGIDVFPLGFKEFLFFKGYPIPDQKELITQRFSLKKEFNDFIKQGGFPKLVHLDKELKKPELIMYFETIILKDIVARYNLKNYENVKRVAQYLLSNIGKPFNLNKVRATLNLSYDLADKYYEYLKDTYLLFELRQFDYSMHKQFSGKRKVYCIDNGVLTHISFRLSEDYGRYLENLIFIELLRRGYETYFYAGKKECDFLIKDGEKIVQAIQVSRTLQDEETKTREIKGLIEAMDAFGLQNGMILTEDEEETIQTNNHKIIVQPVWKWLLV